MTGGPPGGPDAREPGGNDRLARLYESLGPGLYRYALMILADPAAAEDTLQQAFCKVLGVIARQKAPVADWFAADDWHHNGAFLLAHAFGWFSGAGWPFTKPR